MINILSPQDALVAVMILVSAADNEMSEGELRAIDVTIGALPAFENYDRDRIQLVANSVVDILQADDGLDALIGAVVGALPHPLRETGYALACDVAAADGEVALEEMRLLELLRHGLEIDRLSAAAIERGARARHRRVPS